MAKINKSPTITAEKKQEIQTKLEKLPKPVMPEKVHVYTDGKTCLSHLSDDLGKEVNVEQEQELDLDQDQDLQNELQTQVRSQFGSSDYTEWDWDKDLDPTSTSWLKFTHLSSFDEQDRTPPLFQIREILANSPYPNLHGIAKGFDKRLWVSNNFLPLVVKEMGEEPVNIGSKLQRELFEVLVHLEEKRGVAPRILFMGCLSQLDAAIWRKKIANMRNLSSQPIKVILYDTVLRTVVAGSPIDLKKLKENSDFQLLEAKLKFLNGDVLYPKELFFSLAKWLKEQGIENSKKAFVTIHNRRGREPIEDSDIDYIFTDLLKGTEQGTIAEAPQEIQAVDLKKKIETIGYLQNILKLANVPKELQLKNGRTLLHSKRFPEF